MDALDSNLVLKHGALCTVWNSLYVLLNRFAESSYIFHETGTWLDIIDFDHVLYRMLMYFSGTGKMAPMELIIGIRLGRMAPGSFELS